MILQKKKKTRANFFLILSLILASKMKKTSLGSRNHSGSGTLLFLTQHYKSTQVLELLSAIRRLRSNPAFPGLLREESLKSL